MRADKTTVSPGRRRPPPNYFSRKEQYRLFVLVSMFFLVLALMNEARKPANWAWMWADRQPTGAEAPVDTRVTLPARRQLPEHAFVVTASKTAAPAPASPGDPTLPPLLPGVTPEQLSQLKDDTIMRAAETEVWLAIFSTLRGLSDDQLAAMPTADVGFIQLFRQTDVYRGRLVQLSGISRRVEKIQARDNPLGIQRYYRWILDQQGAANAPIVIYSLNVPDDFPLGDHLREYVTFKAVCYKRWAYLAGDGTRVAPLLLAKNASWQAPVTAPPSWLPSVPTLIAMVGTLATLAGFSAIAVYYSSTRLSRQVASIRASTQPAMHAIDEAAVLPRVGEALHQLADKHVATGEQP